MRKDDRAGRVAHPAEPTLPEQRGGGGEDDDLWRSARTQAPHTVVPAHDEVHRWAWDTTR